MPFSSSPLIVLVAQSFPPEEASIHPLALQSLHGSALIEHWWHSLASIGHADPARVFVVTNAVYYKALEFWSLGKGLDISHVVNTGSTLGDARWVARTQAHVRKPRSIAPCLPMTTVPPYPLHPLSLSLSLSFCSVDLQAVLQAVRQARKLGGEEGAAASSVLVIAADSVPAHAGGNGGLLKSLIAAQQSTILLQPQPTEEAAAHAPSGGPEVVATYSPGSGGGAAGSSDAHVVEAVRCSVVAPPASPSPSLSAHSPLVFKLAGADVDTLLAPGALAAVAALIHAGGGGGTSPVLPIDAALTFLAGAGALAGIRIDAHFQVGAADGRPHGLTAPPVSAVEAPVTLGLGAHLHRFVNVGLYGHAAPLHARAHARVGVLGNPSDGYGGKTASLTIANFAAEAWLHPNSDGSITLVPHPVFDPMRFASPAHVSITASREGYSGGVRLMAAAVHRFHAHCKARGVSLPAGKGFSLRYHTTVPRQVGLAGSSAIVTALLRVLMQYYGEGMISACHIGVDRVLILSFYFSYFIYFLLFMSLTCKFTTTHTLTQALGQKSPPPPLASRGRTCPTLCWPSSQRSWASLPACRCVHEAVPQITHTALRAYTHILHTPRMKIHWILGGGGTPPPRAIHLFVTHADGLWMCALVIVVQYATSSSM